MEDTYEVLNLIGRGSFGEIRRVQRHRDGVFLCRKEIMWKRMKPREQEQLAAEIRILRDLQHKNIVRYVSQTVDEETKMVYIYMEYCGNGDLYELIQSRKESSPVVRFSEHTVWQIFAQLAMALFRCHNGVDPPPLEDITKPSTQGMAQIPQAKPGCIVLHRDIKPHNIFLDHNNRVKLGDFGLSKELRGQNLADTYVGTPFYMSPEIIAGRAYNAKSDIWALGCVIYEMCAFDPPFLARDQLDLNRRIKLGVVGSITRFGYSDSLNGVIQSCLRQDEKVRPSAAGLLKKPEMIMARQQLSYCEREEALLDRETQLVARERKIEQAINEKAAEFLRYEQDLLQREERLKLAESSQASMLQESTQRRLLEAERNLQLLAEEKTKLEQRVAEYQSQLPDTTSTSTISTTRPVLIHSYQSDLPLRPGAINHGINKTSSVSSISRTARPQIGRAQTDIVYHVDDDDPLNLKPLPSSPVRPDSSHRNLRSPHRRKSQVPMSRVRAEIPAREPLVDHPTAVQGLTRAMSKQDLCSHTLLGNENIRPSSALGFSDKHAHIARTPTKKTALASPSSGRKMAWPTPTRGTARTLFVENTRDLKTEHHRPAPSAPVRMDRLGTLQRAAVPRKARQSATLYSQDDEPSPFKKSTVYGHRE